MRLISACQVMLLRDNSHSYLFCRGTVYFQPPDTSLRDLPAPTGNTWITGTMGQVVLNIVRVSGRSRRVCQTLFNGCRGATGLGNLCLECLYGI